MIKCVIAIFTVLLLMLSCNSASEPMEENNIDSIKLTMGILRNHGFFEPFKNFTDEQLFDTLHKQRIEAYSEMFERFYDPGMDLQAYQILMLDRDRTVYGDAESDVGKDNDQYVAVLKAFADASGGLFNPVDIIEKWETEKGPIQVSFKEHDQQLIFQPSYHDDWLADEVFSVINNQIAKNGNEKFYMFLDKDGRGLGQNFLYIRMSESQKNKIEKIFGWKFFVP